MKINSKIELKKKLVQRGLLFNIALVIAISVPLKLMVTPAAADKYDDKITALQQEIDSYNAQVKQLASQASTLQTTIAGIQVQVSAIQAQIDVSQAKYDQLTAQIIDTQAKIKNNQDALGKTIADMYVNDQTTPLEMLASSKSIGDYLDKQEYRTSVRNQLTSTISKIKSLKVQLDKQQTDVKSVLNTQQAQKNSLAAAQGQQQYLLNQTQGQESAYQQLIAQNQQQVQQEIAQQQAYYQSLINRGIDASSGVSGDFVYQSLSPKNGAGGCSGGYPYCERQDSAVDPWGLYNRECVSYVAWALVYRFNKRVNNFSGQGNAYEWPSSAAGFSGAVRVYDPKPGDAVILPMSGNFSPLGHAMIVESVDGSWIHVSQYNFYGTGQYSTMDIKNSGIILLRFPDNN
jgi:peptidoglycan hydrolase CwlO-like protein